jgi:HlyD family secretion protein
MSLIRQDTKLRLQELRRVVTEAGSWLVAEREIAAPAEAVAFLDPIDQFCLAPGPRYLRLTLHTVVGLVISLAVIGMVFKVDEFAIARGHLVTNTPPVLIQPVDRAIIRDIRVQPGDHVTKGEVLATLDPTFARADLGSLAAQRAGLQAQRDRIGAELSGHPYVRPANPSPEEAVQVTLYEQRQANYVSRNKMFDAQIAQIEASLKSAGQDIVLLHDQLGVAHEVEDMRQSLYKSQNGSRLNLLDAQAMRLRGERDYGEATNHVEELKHQLQSHLAEKQAFADDWRRQLLESQASIDTQLSMLGESISKASLINDMVVLTSPVDGTILDMAQRTVGSILRGRHRKSVGRRRQRQERRRSPDQDGCLSLHPSRHGEGRIVVHQRRGVQQ